MLSLSAVHHDDVPMPMPDGASPPFAWTLQPAGATFDPPIEVTYPNMSGLPAGAVAYFLSFDHDTSRFEIVATGHVSEDGAEIVTDPGSGLEKSGWGCNCPPYSVTGSCRKCEAEPNGCGAAFFPGTVNALLSTFQIDGVEVSFLAPCNIHDRCYGTCGLSKVACDDQLLGNLRAICDEQFGGDPLRRAECRARAFVYFAVVLCRGFPLYAVGQGGNCLCEAAPELARAFETVVAAIADCARTELDVPSFTAEDFRSLRRFIDRLREIAAALADFAGRLSRCLLDVTLRTVRLGAQQVVEVERFSSDLSEELLESMRRCPAVAELLEEFQEGGGGGAGEFLLTDADGDLLPDDWEAQVGLDPTDSDDLLRDYDADTLANLLEFIHGTDPFEPDSDGDGVGDAEQAAALQPPPPLVLDDSWTVTVGGQTAPVGPDGRFMVANISAADNFGAGGPGTAPDFRSDDFLRVTAVSAGTGRTLYAFSDRFQIVRNEVFAVSDLTKTDQAPIVPERIRFVGEVAVPLLRPGETHQLELVATLGNRSEVDVTRRAAWTVYRTSNPAIATVGENGLVTAAGTGRAIITAVNEGSTAVTRVEVVSERLSVNVEGFVVRENGSAVEGARVTSSAGGAATSDVSGFFSLAIEVGVGQALTLSASFDQGGESLSASLEIPAITRAGTVDAGVLVLLPFRAIPGFSFAGVNAQGYPEYEHVGGGGFVGTGMVFVLLMPPAGEQFIRFEMGSPATELCAGSDERPVHEVLLSPFLIAKHEVSQRVWLEVMGSNPAWFGSGGRGFGSLPADLRADEAWLELPVENVAWLDISGAGGFLARTGLELPSEAQWEYACRGGTSTPFAYGSCISTDQVNRYHPESGACVALTCGVGVWRRHTVPVAPDDPVWKGTPYAIFPPNPFGLYHVHGNVQEWCRDVYDGGYYSRPEARGPDPVALAGPSLRVVRGGSCFNLARYCRSAFRDADVPWVRINVVGFRPARVIAE
jgi:formylglycine-generating enzyme required for sulfatase activity